MGFLGKLGEALREAFQLGGGTADIAHKVVEEPWFGRQVTDTFPAQSVEPVLSDGDQFREFLGDERGRAPADAPAGESYDDYCKRTGQTVPFNPDAEQARDLAEFEREDRERGHDLER